ncbi:glucoamylase family protein [Pontibacter sp. SGAir0037]|uniref:glucoamylase family protein n=1 Tax=Pontibacter sp. SGAir0037 TaxID=2571030 RepID=UPI0010CD1A8B|nr:glucoamylase family protein [Pontibacter sp. SGAir0037]QCR22248.1 beta-glucosidase [Pontibacter sp. SGAir0037]
MNNTLNTTKSNTAFKKYATVAAQALLVSGALFLNSCNQSPAQSTAVAEESTARLSDEQLLTLVQKNTFQYFWDGAEPTSGLARERIHLDDHYPENDQNVITTGASGFGVMAILVGIERGFITREEGFQRLQKAINYLEKADRFHGAWPHWIQGETGKVKPFSRKDNGGDLVESAFLVQGLLCVRQYFADGNAQEKALAAQINRLWEGVEWDWYRNNTNALYWHWSPSYGWEMNFAVSGYNECLIMYVLAAASPTHTIPAEVYHEGWARNGAIKNNTERYGYKIALEHNGQQGGVGPLFWAHYSYLGLDPRGLKDRYADYWQHNVNHTLIHRAYAIDNPKNFEGYGANAWGFTSSYSPRGYAGHSPQEDLGVISPTAALSSYPYTPKESMQVIRHLYEDLGDKMWGKYGFYDAYSLKENWNPPRYLGIDQGPIVVMIENQRSGLLWDLFMSCPEVQSGLKKLGFESPKLN